MCAAVAVSAPAAALQGGHLGALEADDDVSFITANGFLNRGLYELAAEEYEKYLSANPEGEHVRTARYGLAVSLYRLGRHADALERLEEIDTKGFDFAAEVQLLRGHCALASGRFDSALEALESLLRESPQHPSAPDASALLTEARYRAGRHAEAVEAADELAGRAGDHPAAERAGLFAGMALMAQRQWPAAAERLEQTRAAFPEGDLAGQLTLLIAQSRHQAGDVEAARGAYEQALAQGGAAQQGPASLGLAQILRSAGELDEAARLLDELLADEGGAGDELSQLARLERARVWFDRENYRRARRELERLAPDARPDLRDDVAYWSGKCLLRDGEPAAAAEELAIALEEYPKSELAPDMMYDRAVALSRAGDDSADEAFKAFLAKYPERGQSAGALHALIASAHSRADYERSVELSEQFLDERADHDLAPEVAVLWAEGQYLRGNHEQALEGYDRALAMNLSPQRAEQAKFRRAMALRRLGQFDQARDDLAATAERAEQDPLYRPALLALGDGAFDAGDWEQAAEWMNRFLDYGLEQAGADDAAIKLGLARRRQGDLERAADAFSMLLDEWPQSPHAEQARFELAQAHISAGRDDEAQPLMLQVAEAADSRFAPHAMNHLGAIAQRAGNHGEAAEWFERAVAAGGEALREEASFGRARALLAEGRYQDAAAAFDQIASTDPDAPRASSARASAMVALSRAGEHEKAVERFEKMPAQEVALLEPRLRSSARYEHAWSLRRLGQDEAAAEAYRTLLADQPDPAIEPYATLDLASIHRDAGEFAEAMELLEPLVASGPPADALERARYHLGACALELGDHEAVAQWLRTFAEDFPSSELAHSADLLCAEALMKTARSAEAVPHLQRAISEGAGPEIQGPALLRLGEAQASLQRWKESEQAFSRYLDRFGESELWFQAQFGVGFAQENQGLLDEAIKAYRPVAEGHKGPTAARAQFQIGECLFAKKEYDAAVRELLKTDILHAEPEWSAAALYEAGRCFEAMNKAPEARAQYEQVVARFKEQRWAELAQARLEQVRSAPAPGRDR